VEWVSLVKFEVTNIPDTADTKNAFKIVTPDFEMIFNTPKPENKIAWLGHLNKVKQLKL